MTEIAAPASRSFPDMLPRWVGYVACCVGMFMAILDIQVVVTSLAVIQDALHIGAERMSWVQTAYIVAEVIAIPLTGLLIRVFSMRWLFAGALTIFTLASTGCATSSGFVDLLLWRVLQGFAGGVLIPLVFSGIFLLFPEGFQQTLATAIGGILAVLAPTLGPITGGWLTEHYSWHWLFLINLVPGILSVIAGAMSLPRTRINTKLLRELDWLSLIAFGVALALLIIGLKEAPNQGWFSAIVMGSFAASALLTAFAIRRPNPAVMFALLRDRGLAFGCMLSFLLGFILFSAVYVLPVFLAFVRGHGPLDIGYITLAMGLTQLVCAPMTVLLDRYFDARWLTAIGFALFGAGLALDAGLSVNSDAWNVFWPQVLRGAGVALCILPPIRMAMGLAAPETVSDASGLFNLVRNIGGVIGIAACDTVMFGQGPLFADKIMEQITSDPAAAAASLGLKLEDLPAPDDPTGIMSIADLVQGASLTMAINQCWWMLAGVCMLSLPVLLMVGPIRSVYPIKSGNQTL